MKSGIFLLRMRYGGRDNIDIPKISEWGYH